MLGLGDVMPMPPRGYPTFGKAVAESCTKDAFLRKGWEIGKSVGIGKGHADDPDELRRYTRAGYANAKEYLEKIGRLQLD